MTSLHRRVHAKVRTQLGRIGYGPHERSLELVALETQFSDLGLNFQQARTDASTLIDRHQLRRSDDSLHWELFTAISSVVSPKRVLEIGTFRGEFTAFLGSLFPKSHIETWELPSDAGPDMLEYSTDFAKYYHDQSETRNRNLNGLVNVRQVLRDSSHLIRESGTFDLLWVDGDHTFPVVAFDIINTVRLASPKAWIVVDDIRLDASQGVTLGSTESFDCIRHLTETGLIVSSLIYKRIGNSGRHWRDDRRRKHLAVLRPKVAQSHDI
jgi:predicted O-methyltransferase YrrM